MLIKTIGLNLLLFVVYTTLITVNSSLVNKGFNIAVGMGVVTFIQIALNGIAGIAFLIMGKRDFGKAFLISALVLMPVGFCTWLLLLSIYG